MARRHWLRGVLHNAEPATGDGDEPETERSVAPTLPPWFHMLPLAAAAELETAAECLARLRKLPIEAQQRNLHFIITHLETENGAVFADIPLANRESV